ncbi:unnamed protein product [Miscanthus lutarioriparius]|uniref:Uncharacterized protein n=1 Tax=Miscanthus lutarioriparius TaxID=422564 RepID=A0A811QE02_9POAL|nr:unnamed protein product [Miscanthus lutarioriparius]
MSSSCSGAVRRVVLFPFPYQGHFNPVLRLAGALHARGRAPDPADYPADYSFVAVPVTVPADVVASEDIARLVVELNACCAAPFKERLAELISDGGKDDGGVCCVITDVIWCSAQAAARELNVAALGFMTSSAASFGSYIVYPALIEKGYFPAQEERRDDPVDLLPPFRVRDMERIETSSLVDFASVLAHRVDGARQSSGLIINTFDAIEATDLSKIREDLSIPVFSIGPLNKFTPPVKGISLYRLQQDRRCLDWLDTQAPGTVVYVSFGSLAAMDPHEFVELAWGLADSKRPFVWVVRPSLIRSFESGELPDGFREEIGDRGISEGVPTISRPFLGDQFGNARFVCDVWRVGVEVEVETQVERGKTQAAIEKLMGNNEGKALGRG